MAYIKCDGCGEIVEIPAELCPDPETIAITEPYYCDACEPRSGLTKRASDTATLFGMRVEIANWLKPGQWFIRPSRRG